MKIKIDDEVIYECNEKTLDYIHSYINSDNSKKTIKDTVLWSVQSWFDTYKERLKNEWIPVLFKRVSHIPTDEGELLKLIQSQPDYLTQKQKEANEKAMREATFKVE